MGNESSTVVDERTPPQTLEARNIEAVAKYILEKDVRRIVVMVGAGISTSAGIPDFRSPDTGIYANLAFLDLPDPEAVFNIGYFRDNPKPFYALARELYPGKYRPTIAHCFVKLLYDKGRLLKHFTQNIDCLEREAGLPGELIVEAHGSFATQRCIDCKTPYPDDLMRKAIDAGDVPLCMECYGIVKPDIVFFGEALPEAFFLNRTLPGAADLCIVMGTSLSVQPFASLPGFCREGVPRVLINMERVGGLGSRPDDVLVLGDCDAGVRKFAKALGWLDELEALWEATNPDKAVRDAENAPLKTRDERLKDEVDRLTSEVDRQLHTAEIYEEKVRDKLDLPDRNGEDQNAANARSLAAKAPLGVSSTLLNGIERTQISSSVDEGDEKIRQLRATDAERRGHGNLGHVYPHLAGKPSS